MTTHRALAGFVFLGAFLLFAMEPMVGRMLLPSFGGAFHVWTTSLMFFQGALFLGYLHAHLGVPWLERRGWHAAHLALLAVPVLLLPPTARTADGAGVGDLLTGLARDFGLPFVALATTGVVAQRWLAGSALPGRDSPYGLYAISNAGSLLALLSYALLVEPLTGLWAQRWAWTGGYALYLAAAVAAYRATRGGAAPVAHAQGEPVPPGRIAYWLLLSACPSIFLMAVTNLVALDAGNVPLVWVVPLALYLGTFIVAFAGKAPPAAVRLWPHFAAVGLFFFAGGETGGSWLSVGLQLGVLTAVCLAAHGELYACRPEPSRLTLYYLVLSLGGWLGGALVALGAPVLFRGLYEYPLALALLGAAMLVARRRELLAAARGPGRVLAVLTVLLVAAIGWQVARGTGRSAPTRMLEVERSFYGLYYVLERDTPHGAQRVLVNGTTRHGRQFVDEPRRREPLSYYHRRGPLGHAMEAMHLRGHPLRIAVVGLGVGAAAAYVEPGETIDYFEIDPVVVALARRHFSYLRDCRGAERTIVGDARLTLAALGRGADPPRYDVLLVDAFAGDAIPTHLVTREAVDLYRRLLGPGGLLLFHVSNRFYDLRPVLAQIARRTGLEAAYEQNLARPDETVGIDPSQYVALFEPGFELAPFVERGFRPITDTDPPPVDLWTDDHTDTLAALMPDW